MIIIQLAKQSFQPIPQVPEACPYCSCRGLLRFGRRQRKVKDLEVKVAHVQRYCCKGCQRTFSAHPDGLGHSPQTHQYMALLVVLYTLGLSLRGLILALSLFGVPSVSFVSVWRDVQRLGRSLRGSSLKSRIVGVDTTFVRVRGHKQGILVAVDLGGRAIIVEAVGNPEDYQQAFAQLKALGAEMIISDDDVAFHSPVEEQGLRQQACLFHAQRALGRALGKLTPDERVEHQALIGFIKESLRSPPVHPPEELFAAQRLSLPPPLRGIVVYLLNLWHRLSLYQRYTELPKTNNLTERAIQKSKMRARSVRGFGSTQGALNFFAVTQDWAA